MAKRAVYTEARELTGGKFSFPEGNILIIGAEVTNRTMRKADGSDVIRYDGSVAKDTVLKLTGQLLDSNWKKIDDSEPCSEEVQIALMGGTEDFHPGMIDESEIDNLEADIEDLGDADGVVGNTFVQVGDRGLVAAKLIEQGGKKVWSGAGYTILMKSLELQGAKPAILNRAYCPDLVGIKGHVCHQPRYKGPNAKADSAPMALVFDKVVVFPGQQDEQPKPAAGKTASKPAASAAAKPATKANGAVKPATPTAEVDEQPSGTDDIMLDAGMVYATLKSKHSGKSVPLTRMGNEAMIASMELNPKPAIEVTRKLQSLFKDGNWLVENFGATVEGSAVQF